jgi:hypothetical protein
LRLDRLTGLPSRVAMREAAARRGKLEAIEEWLIERSFSPPARPR